PAVIATMEEVREIILDGNGTDIEGSNSTSPAVIIRSDAPRIELLLKTAAMQTVTQPFLLNSAFRISCFRPKRNSELFSTGQSPAITAVLAKTKLQLQS